MSMRPAWSDRFEPDRIRVIDGLGIDGPITPEWAWGDSTGAGVRVAIVDSGVDGSHARVGELAGAVAFEFDPDAPDGARIVEGHHDDLVGHGTACAGIIRIAAPGCDITSVRVLGANLKGKGLVFAAGLRWAIEQRFDVVNLSLSTGKQEFYGLFHELADEAYFHNVHLVSAANNIVAPSYPSLYSSVYSVAAHEGTDPFRFHYNPEPPVEFGAPGLDVEVAWLGGSTMTTTGNSFAAPHMAGLVARILGKHPGLTPFQVKTILHALADNVATPSSP